MPSVSDTHLPRPRLTTPSTSYFHVTLIFGMFATARLTDREAATPDVVATCNFELKNMHDFVL